MTFTYAIPLLLAVASGLSVIAFKTPKIFLRLALPLIGLLLLVQAVVIAWDIGFQRAYVVFSKFIPNEKSAAADLVLKEYSIPWEFMLYVFCAAILIGFLNWLSHQVIEHAEEHEPTKKNCE